MSLPRTAETAVIRNLSLIGNNSETLAHYIQINLKSSGNIVVQGETRSFTVSDLEKFKGTLAVIGANSSSQALSTPLIVLLAVLLVLVALAAALFFVRRHKYKCNAAEKGHEANGGTAVHFGNGSRIEMYGEIAQPESPGENLLGDVQMADASPIPEWPEPPPQWPEPGKTYGYSFRRAESNSFSPFRGERSLPAQRAFRPANVQELDRQQLVEPPQRLQQRDRALRHLRRRPERQVVHPERERGRRLQQRHGDGGRGHDPAAGRQGVFCRDQRAAGVRHEREARERNFVICNEVIIRKLSQIGSHKCRSVSETGNNAIGIQ